MNSPSTRYIARTNKHEHAVVVSTVCNAASLPARDFRNQQEGWVEYCGTAVWLGPCPTCGKRLALTGHAVTGRYSEKRKCDARCTSATGHNCECQCGGKNHGAEHDAA